MDERAPTPARLIFHVDGDAFFASCEVARDPTLRGKPVVTGAERGIVSSASYEAKRLGVGRGVPLAQVRRRYPQVIVLASDYEMYQMYSKRMYAIARRYTPVVEEYGIDECFGDLTGIAESRTAEERMREMRADLARELNMTFSVGLAHTKVLAKLGSKHRKPDGFTVITRETASEYLRATPLNRVWGIGPATARKLEKLGLKTALDLTDRSRAWVAEHFSKPLEELRQELGGESVLRVEDSDAVAKSIQVTRTFTPPERSSGYLLSQLSKNAEGACEKARRRGLAARHISFFLKTQGFSYAHLEAQLPRATNIPSEVFAAVQSLFPQVFQEGALYRATGVVLSDFENTSEAQLDLFDAGAHSAKLSAIYEKVDLLRARYGKHALYLGSSACAIEAARADAAPRARALDLWNGAHAAKRLPLPYLGEVN